MAVRKLILLTSLLAIPSQALCQEAAKEEAATAEPNSKPIFGEGFTIPEGKAVFLEGIGGGETHELQNPTIDPRVQSSPPEPSNIDPSNGSPGKSEQPSNGVRDDDGAKSVWDYLPALLGGLAAFITAIATLIGVMRRRDPER